MIATAVCLAGVVFAHGGGGGGGLLLPLGLFTAFGAVAIVVWYLHYLWEKRRTEAMRHFAEEMGFDFSAEPDPSFIAEVARLHLFDRGHSKRFGNLMRGEANGLEVRLFDYWYRTGSGKSKSTHVQTVLCFLLPGEPLPSFSMRPQNFFHVIGTWFGYQDINFEEHPKFSGKYLLRGEDEEA